jgi:NADPH:quinone reductase
MNAIVINKFGEASGVFENIKTPIPVPNNGEVLINVMATSVNPIDIHLRKGNMAALIPAFPAILHGDVAGVVAAIGPDVTAFKKGEPVYGWTGGFSGSGGALAEFMIADQGLLAKPPANISYREAAAVPLVSLTAYEAIFERARIQPGQKILIYGGIGGVGHMGVQFAKIAGAEVYAMVSDDSHIPIVQNLGADYVINYHQLSTDDLLQKYTSGLGFDVIFDTVGNQHLTNSFQAVKAHGTVVTTIALTQVDLTLLQLKAATLHVVFLVLPIAHHLNDRKTKFGEHLAIISGWLQQGKINVLTDPAQFRFEDIAAAHQYAESGKNIGKLVISR